MLWQNTNFVYKLKLYRLPLGEGLLFLHHFFFAFFHTNFFPKNCFLNFKLKKKVGAIKIGVIKHKFWYNQNKNFWCEK